MRKKMYLPTEDTVSKKKFLSLEIDTDYTQLYTASFKYMAGVRYVYSFKLLCFLFTRANEYGLVDFKQRLIDEFCEQIGYGDKSMTAQQMYRYVNDLMDQKLIIKIGKGEYLLNPFLFWRGNTKDRMDFIKSVRISNDYNLFINEKPEK